jgi:probable HAF family extracellular repeat protein
MTVSHRPLITLAAAALLAVSAQPAAAWSTYKVTQVDSNLPPNDPTIYVTAVAVNNAQRTVRRVAHLGESGGFRICAQSLCSDLSLPPGSYHAVYGLSNFGHVAGSVLQARQYAFVNGGVIGYDRANCSGCGLTLDSEALGINSYGQAAGWAEFSSGGGHRAFRYIPGATTGMYEITSLGGDSEGRAINEWGHVAGVYASGAATRAFRSDYPNLTMIDLGTLGGSSTWAYAINDGNRVVGCSVNGNGVLQAFRHNAVYMLGLPTLSPTGASCALDVNNSHVAVGYSANGSGQQRAVIFDGPNVKNLNLLLDPNDPETAKWSLVSATGINDSGAIVGNGKYLNVDRAFVLTPQP